MAACVTVWDGASGELRERGRVLGVCRHPKVLPGGPLPWGRGEGERLGRVLGALLGRSRGGGPGNHKKIIKTNRNWWFWLGFGGYGEAMGGFLENRRRLRKRFPRVTKR